jgi:hypothetical protein
MKEFTKSMHIMTEDEILREKMIEREGFYADMHCLKERAHVAGVERDSTMAELAKYKEKYGELK